MEEKKEAFDLDSLDLSGDTVHEFQVRNPVTKEPLDFWIAVVGFDSDSYQEEQRRIARAQQKRLKREKRDALDPREVEEAVTALFAFASRGWRGSVLLGGKPLPPFNQSAAQSLYTRFRWLREQVAEDIGEREHFLPQPAKG